jgi:hypothetical protein
MSNAKAAVSGRMRGGFGERKKGLEIIRLWSIIMGFVIGS